MLDNNINKKLPFKVPENYFESFNKEILAKLPQKEIQPRKVLLWKRLTPWVAAAAMVSGVLLSVSIALSAPESKQQLPQTTSKNAPLASSSEDDEFYKYIEEQSVNALYNETLLNEDSKY